MRPSKLVLILVIAELAFALIFAVTTVTVVLFRKDDLWLQGLLVAGGLAGLMNGLYLLNLRKKSKAPPRRRSSGEGASTKGTRTKR